MRLLLTGFEPFGGYAENSSWEVAKAVASCGVLGVEVIAEQLPVSFHRVEAMLRTFVERHRPDVIIMLGQSALTDRVKLERVALNMMDSRMAITMVINHPRRLSTKVRIMHCSQRCLSNNYIG